MLANLLKCDIILVVTDITLVSISAGIAQSVEHFTRNEGVVGSSPISSFQLLDAKILIFTRILAFFLFPM